MAKQKRDSAYYLCRIEREFPHVFADYQAGKFGSVAEATIATGIKKLRTAGTAERLAKGHQRRAAGLASRVLRRLQPNRHSDRRRTGEIEGAGLNCYGAPPAD